VLQVDLQKNVNVTGIGANIALNNVAIKIQIANITLTGLSMTTQVGSINSYGWNVIDTGTSVVYTVIAA
jgi:hypothetical protein